MFKLLKINIDNKRTTNHLLILAFGLFFVSQNSMYVESNEILLCVF